MFKKLFVCLLSLALILTLPSCYYSSTRILLTSPSGTLTVQTGLADSLVSSAQLDTSGMTAFESDGKTYLGDTQTFSFSDLSSLNALLDNLSSTTPIGSILKEGTFTLSTEGDATTLTVKGGIDDAAVYRSILDSGDTGLDIESALDSAVISYTFVFPGEVYQTAGSTSGVSIDNNTLTLDLTQTGPYLQFSTTPFAGDHITFVDVPDDAWYYEAVTALADAGLVNGTGEGCFSPTAPITRAEVLQIIARAKGLATGEADGHWAGQAVRACLEAGYIIPGSIQDDSGIVYTGSGAEVSLPGVWKYKLGTDVQVTREEAIGILFRAAKDSLSEAGAALTKEVYSAEFRDLVNELIPDADQFNEGADGYENENFLAFLTGMVTGDEEHRMRPEAVLSRAEFCQMAYNLGWANQ